MMFDHPYPKQGEYSLQDVLKDQKTTKRPHNDSNDYSGSVDLSDSVIAGDAIGSPPPAKVARPGPSKDLQSMPGTSISSLVKHLKKRDSAGKVFYLPQKVI